MRFTQPDLHYRKRMVASAQILLGGGIDAHLLIARLWVEEKSDATNRSRGFECHRVMAAQLTVAAFPDRSRQPPRAWLCSYATANIGRSATTIPVSRLRTSRDSATFSACCSIPPRNFIH